MNDLDEYLSPVVLESSDEDALSADELAEIERSVEQRLNEINVDDLELEESDLDESENYTFEVILNAYGS